MTGAGSSQSPVRASFDVCVGHAGDPPSSFPPHLSARDLAAGTVLCLKRGRAAGAARGELGSTAAGPAVLGWFGVDGMRVVVVWASPEGGHVGGIFAAGVGPERCRWRRRWGAGLADQAELAGAGDGFGAVGRAEFVQEVADVFLDGVEGDDQFGGYPPVRPSGGEQSEPSRV